MKRLYIGNFVAIPKELFEKLTMRKTTFIATYKLRSINVNTNSYKLKSGLKVTHYDSTTYHKFVALQKIEKLVQKKIFIIDKDLRTQIW